MIPFREKTLGSRSQPHSRGAGRKELEGVFKDLSNKKKKSLFMVVFLRLGQDLENHG